MRTFFPHALVALMLGCLAEATYAEEQEATTKEEAAVEAMTTYKPPLQRYTVHGIQPDERPSVYSPVTQELVWNSAVTSNEVYVDHFHQAGDLEPFPCCHFSVDAGVYYLKPHLENNPAFILQQRAVTGGGPLVFSNVDNLNYHPEFAPRLSLGASLDSGLGIRTTWWHFDDGSPTATATNFNSRANAFVQTPPMFGVPGFTSPGAVARTFGIFNDVMQFGTHLDTHVWDWEATQTFHPGGWGLLFSEGVRYTYLSQNYQALRNNFGLGTLGTSRVNLLRDSDLVRTGHNFNGAGPTGAFEVRHALWDTGFTLYGTGRASVLFGRGRTQSFQGTFLSEQIIPRTGRTTSTNTTATFRGSNGHDDVMPVTDLEVGIEWSHLVGHARLFVQTGLVASDWFYAGSGTSEQGDLSFFGMNVTMGVCY